ncbi:hypothetical protein EGT07_14820 [Herbaspirillum sp. HC18]|nr:hypothetical protein EGT07_14820 [Herbaspirillum sp. HC18]
MLPDGLPDVPLPVLLPVLLPDVVVVVVVVVLEVGSPELVVPDVLPDDVPPLDDVEDVVPDVELDVLPDVEPLVEPDVVPLVLPDVEPDVLPEDEDDELEVLDVLGGTHARLPHGNVESVSLPSTPLPLYTYVQNCASGLLESGYEWHSVTSSFAYLQPAKLSSDGILTSVPAVPT